MNLKRVFKELSPNTLSRRINRAFTDVVLSRFGEKAKEIYAPSPHGFRWPRNNASIEEHMRYLIECRNYVQNYPIEKGACIQYRHNIDSATIGDGESHAITDCSYEFRGSLLPSMGFPFQIQEDQAFIFADNNAFEKKNIGFNSFCFAQSFGKIVEHFLQRPLTLADGKIGYQAGTHNYIEWRVNNEKVFLQVSDIINTYIRSTEQAPLMALKEIKRNLETAASRNLQQVLNLCDAEFLQAETEDGTAITRVPLESFQGYDQRLALLKGALDILEIPYSTPNSATLGETLRVTGAQNILKLNAALRSKPSNDQGFHFSAPKI